MYDLFDTIVISGEVGVKKPDPNIFCPALDETQSNPIEVVYVGDTQEDITAARAANMKPILIQREDKGTDSTALDFSVDQQEEARANRIDASVISSLPEIVLMLEQE